MNQYRKDTYKIKEALRALVLEKSVERKSIDHSSRPLSHRFGVCALCLLQNLRRHPTERKSPNSVDGATRYYRWITSNALMLDEGDPSSLCFQSHHRRSSDRSLEIHTSIISKEKTNVSITIN